MPATDAAAGRLAKANGHTASMYAAEQSDDRVVPAKQPNNGGLEQTPAEVVEERRSTSGNASQTAAPRTQRRVGESIGLQRVREAARNVHFYAIHLR